MIRSMTGFGRAEAEREGRTLVAEARSVNHRYLEFSIRLPRGFQPLESKLRQALQERLERGKINITVNWKGAGNEGGLLSVNTELAGQYIAALRELRETYDFRDPVTLAQVTSLPDVLQWSEPELDGESAWDLLQGAVTAAIADMVAMREAEGKALGKDLAARLETLRTALAAVQARSPERAKEAKEKLRTRVAELLAGEAEVDGDRLLVEAAFLAERMDCTEECVRLASHIDQFAELLGRQVAVGRKLNFLTQEMNREANTIGSKSNDTEVSQQVIQLKEEIEILREQIQNVE